MTDAAPFISNAEYLASESLWLRQRAESLAAQEELRRDRAHGGRWSRSTDDGDSQERRIVRLRDREEATRRRIDARLASGARRGSFRLGMDQLQAAHDLSPLERLALLVGALVSIDQRVSAAIETLDQVSWTTTPNVCLTLAKQGFADRLRSRASFEPGSPLLRGGLITWTQGTPTAPALTTSTFEISPWAFEVVIEAS